MGSGDVAAGAVEPGLAAEFPGLELWTASTTIARAAGPAGRARLAHLSGVFRPGERIRTRGGRLVDPAHAAFERQVGLDPAGPPTDLERRARETILAGRLVPTTVVDDVRLAVLAESDLVLGALDAHRTRGPWSVRVAAPRETVGGRTLRDGALVVADADGPVAPVIGDPAPELAPGRHTTDVLLYAVRVPGLPSWEVSEAVWRAARYLAGE